MLFWQCNPAGCLFELLVQLAVIMVGKQIFNNFIEIIVPSLKKLTSVYLFQIAREKSWDYVLIKDMKKYEMVYHN